MAFRTRVHPHRLVFYNMALTGDNNKIQDVHSQVSGAQACFPSNISELLWEDKDRTLRELIATFRLPLFLKLKTGDISSYIVDNVPESNETKFSGSSQVSSPSVCDTSAIARSSSTYSSNGVESKKTPVALSGQSDVILQIHETRRKKIIQARKMTWEKRQNDYVVSGEQVEIPASYKGKVACFIISLCLVSIYLENMVLTPYTHFASWYDKECGFFLIVLLL